MRKVIFIAGVLVLMGVQLKAQELQARITVNSSRIGSQVDKKVFQTLQTSLNNFVNNRKWTNHTFSQQEKIICNFLLNIEKLVGTNIYQASLTIQAARPVYNSAYQTPLINHMDEGVVFRYVEFQPLEFNENRVQGTDPIAANLTAIFAYYVYVILGLDFNSFAPREGEQYFQKAQSIVNNAPESRDITGWRAFDGLRNRYWLTENLTNNRYNIVHDAMYSYFRLGMDHMYENEATARTAILNSLNMLGTLNTEIPNSMIIQFFFQGRSGELIKVFKKASPDEKSRALDVLGRVDVSNASLYKLELR
ncbi:MAG TPA: DUF4835 family protein [Chitinophagaceae bacterium]|nr:DUF4835 family protein [Chitinophagaceae bacterium]